MRLAPTLLLLTAGLLSGCGADEPTPAPFVPIQGAAIDGSEDTPAEEAPATEVASAPAEPVTADAVEVQPTSTGSAAQVEPAAPEAEPESPAGPIEVSFWDLSLYELDVDAMLDAMLHPEEYDEEELVELAFPEETVALVGQEVVIKGYMIPGKMERGNVRDFMLVRDLLGCCFGQAPLPDEWVDVVMAEDADAEYYQYIPIRVTGTFTLGGEQDRAGFARGVYKLLATDIEDPD